MFYWLEDLCFPQTQQKQHFGWFGKAGESFQSCFGMVGEAFEVFGLSRASSTADINEQPLVVESRKVKVSCWWFLFWKAEKVGRGLNGLGDVGYGGFQQPVFRSVKKRFHFNLLKSLLKFFVCSF